MATTDLTKLDIQAPAIVPKEGDVYRFVYSDESWKRAKSGFGHGDLLWCFDGQLVYRDGLLCDTYWGFDWRGDTGRVFTPEAARAKGELSLVCNLNDVEKIPNYDFPLYAKGDAFNLSHQHGCYEYFVKRKGARKDKALMLAALREKVCEAQRNVESAIRSLESAVERRERLTPRIEAGEEPYI